MRAYIGAPTRCSISPAALSCRVSPTAISTMRAADGGRSLGHALAWRIDCCGRRRGRASETGRSHRQQFRLARGATHGAAAAERARDRPGRRPPIRSCWCAAATTTFSIPQRCQMEHIASTPVPEGGAITRGPDGELTRRTRRQCATARRAAAACRRHGRRRAHDAAQGQCLWHHQRAGSRLLQG